MVVPGYTNASSRRHTTHCSTSDQAAEQVTTALAEVYVTFLPLAGPFERLEQHLVALGADLPSVLRLHSVLCLHRPGDQVCLALLGSTKFPCMRVCFVQIQMLRVFKLVSLRL